MANQQPRQLKTDRVIVLKGDILAAATSMPSVRAMVLRGQVHSPLLYIICTKGRVRGITMTQCYENYAMSTPKAQIPILPLRLEQIPNEGERYVHQREGKGRGGKGDAERTYGLWDLAGRVGTLCRRAGLRVGAAGLVTGFRQLLRQLLLLVSWPQAACEVRHGHLQLRHLPA